VSVSTVHSAKGYDAYCVLVASADDFPADVKGRTAFYVACTRAVEHLEVLAGRHVAVAAEMQRVADRVRGTQ
jgi:superfamily I DNA/RNA helicase